METMQAGIAGTVTVKAELDIDGNFRVLEIVDGLGYGLDEAALAALQTWTFRPACRSGRRVPVVASIDVEFRNPSTEDVRWALLLLTLKLAELRGIGDDVVSTGRSTK